MDSISVKIPVTIKTKLTEKVRATRVQEITTRLQQVDLELQQINIQELNEHTPPQAVARLLDPLRVGHDLGLISEAGCPAIADPGAVLVALAHDADIPVVPMVGPSSLLLALMGSGL